MVRQKKPKLIIAFNTTTAALAFEDICKLGRLIPVPTQVKAGCGLAYCANIEFENEIDQMLKDHKIEFYTKQIVSLWAW